MKIMGIFTSNSAATVAICGAGTKKQTDTSK
jgi:hypothetical protein